MSWVATGDQVNAQDLINETFDSEAALDNWTSFDKQSRPNISLFASALKGARSNSGRLTALSKNFEVPQTRIAIEFTLAFSKTKGRAFHVWSQSPNGTDASQLNLCVQNGTLQQYDGRSKSWKVVSRNVMASESIEMPVWHRVRAIIDEQGNGMTLFVSKPGNTSLPTKPSATAAVYRTDLPIGGISFVSGTRIAENAWYLIDDLVIKGGIKISAPAPAPELPKPFALWTAKRFPKHPHEIPFVDQVRHQTIHRPNIDQPKFLHGAAIAVHQGVMYANWANSPTNENGPHETLKGRHSHDFGKTWSDLYTIAPGFQGSQRHSHGILFEHRNQLWTICSRFGKGEKGRRFNGLTGEAFVWQASEERWESQGIVMENCWPYDEPVRMANGNYITGGQDKTAFQ